MTNRITVFISCLLSCALTPSRAADTAPLRIVLCGDSTMCEYPIERPDRGWGMFVQAWFDDSVKVTNLAKGGRSTKTFIKEGLWKKSLDLKPDFIFIQFGHNDSHPSTKPEATDAATDYKENLRRYIDEARAINAKPILITPMVRRIFGADGKLANELQRYADAMKEVAAEKKAPLIDLHTMSKALVEPLGSQGSADMANKAGDLTHFGVKGAKAMADLVLKELPSAAPELLAHLKK